MDNSQNPEGTPPQGQESREVAGGINVPSDPGVTAVDGSRDRPVRDIGSLAIGGTIGGLVAARALRGAMGGGAKRIVAPVAASYLAQRLREARAGAAAAADTTSEPTQANVEPLPVETVAGPEPEQAVEAGLPPQPCEASEPESQRADEPCEIPSDEAPTVVDRELFLDPSAPASLESRDSLGFARDLEVEAREAESELEEALFLLAEESAKSPADDEFDGAARGGGLLADGCEEADEGEVEGVDRATSESGGQILDPEPPKPVRSPFLRDHQSLPAAAEAESESVIAPVPKPEDAQPSAPVSRVPDQISSDLPGPPVAGPAVEGQALPPLLPIVPPGAEEVDLGVVDEMSGASGNSPKSPFEVAQPDTDGPFGGISTDLPEPPADWVAQSAATIPPLPIPELPEAEEGSPEGSEQPLPPFEFKPLPVANVPRELSTDLPGPPADWQEKPAQASLPSPIPELPPAETDASDNSEFAGLPIGEEGALPLPPFEFKPLPTANVHGEISQDLPDLPDLPADWQAPIYGSRF